MQRDGIRIGVGVILDLTPHDISISNLVLDSRPGWSAE
jgi:hypothetical protein